jgi:hypothetical protein
MQIFQNGKQIGSAPVSASFARQLKSLGQLKEMKWGEGIYGRFSGRSIEGTIPTGQAN